MPTGVEVERQLGILLRKRYPKPCQGLLCPYQWMSKTLSQTYDLLFLVRNTDAQLSINQAFTVILSLWFKKDCIHPSSDSENNKQRSGPSGGHSSVTP